MIAAGHARAMLVDQSRSLHQPSQPARPRDAFHFRRRGDGLRAGAGRAADGANSWDIVATRLEAQFSNNIRNNFGPMNRFDPTTVGTPDKLITQKGRKVFKEVVPMVVEFHAQASCGQRDRTRRSQAALAASSQYQHERSHRKKGSGARARPHEAPNILDEFGNTSSAGSIIAFHKYSADLQPGDLGHLCSFGAGYTAGSVILKKRG